MKILIHQFTVERDPETNLRTIEAAVDQAVAQGARLLLLPEGVISRDPDDPDITVAGAQPIDGAFITRVRELSKRGVAIAATVHVQAGDGRTSNLGIVCDRGQLIHSYDKLHLYDAFNLKESDRIAPGRQMPGVFDLDGVIFGLLTCYDIRFPEASRALAVAGADVILLPAAWVRGPLKEHHWRTMITARALENTVYVLASGECGPRNCGLSMAVDPVGVVEASAAECEQSILAEVDLERLRRVRTSLPVLANRRFADPVLTS